MGKDVSQSKADKMFLMQDADIRQTPIVTAPCGQCESSSDMCKSQTTCRNWLSTDPVQAGTAGQSQFYSDSSRFWCWETVDWLELMMKSLPNTGILNQAYGIEGGHQHTTGKVAKVSKKPSESSPKVSTKTSGFEISLLWASIFSHSGFPWRNILLRKQSQIRLGALTAATDFGSSGGNEATKALGQLHVNTTWPAMDSWKSASSAQQMPPLLWAWALLIPAKASAKSPWGKSSKEWLSKASQGHLKHPKYHLVMRHGLARTHRLGVEGGCSLWLFPWERQSLALGLS